LKKNSFIIDDSEDEKIFSSIPKNFDDQIFQVDSSKTISSPEKIVPLKKEESLNARKENENETILEEPKKKFK
jgi:hypothetical protein